MAVIAAVLVRRVGAESTARRLISSLRSLRVGAHFMTMDARDDLNAFEIVHAMNDSMQVSEGRSQGKLFIDSCLAGD